MNNLLTFALISVLGIVFTKVFISKKPKKSILEEMKKKYPPSKSNLWQDLAMQQHIDKYLEEDETHDRK